MNVWEPVTLLSHPTPPPSHENMPQTDSHSVAIHVQVHMNVNTCPTPPPTPHSTPPYPTLPHPTPPLPPTKYNGRLKAVVQLITSIVIPRQ